MLDNSVEFNGSDVSDTCDECDLHACKELNIFKDSERLHIPNEYNDSDEFGIYDAYDQSTYVK